MTRNAGIYVRISLDPNGTRLGVTRQTQACTQKAADLGWHVHHVYEDNDVSATSLRPRPAYEQMLTDLREGTIDAVIVWDLDRLTRRPIEIEHFITLADEHRIALASVGGDVDLATDNGRLFARIKGAVARAEIERKSARMKAANAQRRTAGIHRTGRRPFGYTLDRTTHVEHEAAWLRKIIDDILHGIPIAACCRTLNAAGVPTAGGGIWRPSELRRLVRHPRNAGLLTHRGEVVGPGTWPPIIDEHTLAAVVALLDLNAKANRPRPSPSLLTGLAMCDVCEALIYSTRSGRHPRRYYCSTRWHVTRKADPIDEHVTARLLQILKAAPEQPQGADNAELADALTRLQSLRDRLEAFADQAADGGLSPAAYARVEKRLAPQIKAAQQTATALSRPARLRRYDFTDPDALWASLDLDERRFLIAQTVTIRVASPGIGVRDFAGSTVTVTPQW